MAANRLRHEGPGITLQATGLVHEAFLRLVGAASEDQLVWQNRKHFFGAAAESMRRVLVDSARRRVAQKGGGNMTRDSLDQSLIPSAEPDEEILAIHEVLDQLSEIDPAAAQLVKLRFFAGMTMSEIADILGISVRSAQGIWKYARAWLRTAMSS